MGENAIKYQHLHNDHYSTRWPFLQFLLLCNRAKRRFHRTDNNENGILTVILYKKLKITS